MSCPPEKSRESLFRTPINNPSHPNNMMVKILKIIEVKRPINKVVLLVGYDINRSRYPFSSSPTNIPLPAIAPKRPNITGINEKYLWEIYP